MKRVLVVTAWIAAIGLLTVIYTLLSMTIPVGSDQANSALQGQDLAAGNILLKGWTLSPISLYVPDLVLYAVVVSIFGVNPVAVHIANALMYALLVALSVILARGPRTAKHRVMAGLITAALLIAPQLGVGVDLLLLEGSHVGVVLLVVLALIAVERAPREWEGIVAALAVLAAGVVADGLAIIIGAIPFVAASAMRLVRHRPGMRSDLGLLLAGALSVPLGMLVVLAVRRLHGFVTYPLAPALANPTDMSRYLRLAATGLVGVFGVDPTNAHGLFDYLGIGVHAVGLVFIVLIVGLFAWRWLVGKQEDRISELLLAAIACDLGAFLLAAHPDSSRYLIAVFVFAAIIAGRSGAELVAGLRPLWPARAIAAGFVAVLGVSLTAPPAPIIHPWSSWLLDHHLYRGVGSYWQASSVTVETEGRVVVRPILSDSKQANGYAWESKASWYRPDQLGDVRFVIYDVTDHQFGITRAGLENIFGPPDDSVRFGNVAILVWNHNLVPGLTLT
jgi:hypothetical protein